MKKHFLTALSIICILGLKAQTINQANFEPANGEQYATYQCDSTTVSVGPNGAGINWAFGGLVIHTGSNAATNYTTTTGTFPAFPSSSIQVSAGATNNSYYSGTASDLKFWGGNISFGVISAELKFSNPELYMVYPTALNGGTTSPVAGSITAVGNPGTFTGVCTVTALATGTMVLPAKTFSDVIRVTNNISVNYTVVIPGTATRINYDFYSLSHSKYPILTISESTITGAGNSVQKFAYVQKNYQNVSLESEAMAELNSLSVYPNPSSSTVNFATSNPEAKSVSVYDVTGKLIETQLLFNGKLNLNVNNYNNGLYIYKLISSSNKPLKTGKLTVNH